MKVIERCDVILEVIDARDPLGFRSRAIERLVDRSGKHLILVVNKADLVPRDVLDGWVKLLTDFYPTVLFKSDTRSSRGSSISYGGRSGTKHKTQLGRSKFDVETAPDDVMHRTREALGVKSLLATVKRVCGNPEAGLIIGVIGYPNTGKSSVINSLCGTVKAKVAAEAGHTKCIQEVLIQKNIRVMDSPGVVFARKPSDETVAEDPLMVLRNVYRVQELTDPVRPVEVLWERADKQALAAFFGLSVGSLKDELDSAGRAQGAGPVERDPFDFGTSPIGIDAGPVQNAMDFLCRVAVKRGLMKQGGVPHVEEMARRILKDWNDGRIPYFTRPPTRDQLGLDVTAASVRIAGQGEGEVKHRHDMSEDVAAQPPSSAPSSGIALTGEEFDAADIAHLRTLVKKGCRRGHALIRKSLEDEMAEEARNNGKMVDDKKAGYASDHAGDSESDAWPDDEEDVEQDGEGVDDWGADA